MKYLTFIRHAECRDAIGRTVIESVVQGGTGEADMKNPPRCRGG